MSVRADALLKRTAGRKFEGSQEVIGVGKSDGIVGNPDFSLKRFVAIIGLA